MPIANDLEKLLADRATKPVGQEEALAVFNGMIDKFSDYMEKLPDPRAAAPLSSPEKALLRTFLVAVYREKI